MINLFIDESGTLPDLNDEFIIISGVALKQIKEAENIFSRVSSSLKSSKTFVREIKFYHSGQKTKRQFLSGLVSANFKIFILAVDKKKRKIADSPENYGLLVAEIINEINFWYKLEKINIVLDKHFSRKVDQDDFNNFLRNNMADKLEYTIKHADSRVNRLVNLADMAAGAVLQKYNKKDEEFYNIIKDNIVIEKIVSWPEIKRKSIKKLT